MMPASIVLLLRRAAAASIALAVFPLAAQTPPDADAVVRGIVSRLKTAYAYKNWAASAVTTTTETDRRGQPEKVTVVHRTIRIENGHRQETILKAFETEDGETTDVTARYLEEQKKQRERYEKQRAEGRSSGARPSGRHMHVEDILPFAPEKRSLFEFSTRPSVDPSGRKLILLDVRAKEKDSQNWEGTFTVDPLTFDILAADAKPSKNPTFVKTLEAHVDVEIVEGKHMFIQRSRIKVDGGFLFIKRVRRIVEDVYSDIRILG